MSSIDRLISRLLLCSLLLLAAGNPSVAWGQDSEEDPVTVTGQRNFNEDSLAVYRANPEYDFERNTSSNWWDNFRNWLKNLFDLEPEMPSGRPVSAPAVGVFWQVLMWILIGALAAFLLFQLLNVNFRKLIKKKSDEGNIDYREKEEKLEDLEFDRLIKEAVENGKFRTAVRLHYLQSLKLMQDRNLIRWRSEKTNYEYLEELKPGPVRSLFGNLTRIFEFIWYGEHDVDKAAYLATEEDFRSFDNQLKGGEK